MVRPSYGGMTIFELNRYGCRAMSSSLLSNIGRAIFTVDDPHQDILRDDCFADIVWAVWLCVPASLLWIAVPCNTWGYLNSSNTMRSKQRPSGNIKDPKVRAHNKLATRISKLLPLISLRRCYHVIENPTGSRLYDYRPMKLSLRDTLSRLENIRLSSFGSLSAKPLWIHSSWPLIWRLVEWSDEMRKPNSRCKPLTKRDPKRSKNASADATMLKLSLGYPVTFANIVGEMQASFLVKAQVACFTKVIESPMLRYIIASYVAYTWY